MRRKPIIQAALPKNARKVFEKKVSGRVRQQGECQVVDLQPSTRRPCIVIGGKRLRVHIWAYAIYRGDIPAGLCVCHACDVPRCINPQHLWLGTQRENLRDMKAKGRGYRHTLYSMPPYMRGTVLIVPFLPAEDRFISALRAQNFTYAEISELATKCFDHKRSPNSISARLQALAHAKGFDRSEAA